MPLFRRQTAEKDAKANFLSEKPPVEAPPTYSVAVDQLNEILGRLNLHSEPTDPTVDTCLAHLKLLNAFFNLKEEIGYTDGLFGLWDSRAPGNEESVAGDDAARKARDEALSKVREKRWSLYVARAVDRFEVWWTHVLCEREAKSPGSYGRLRQSDYTDQIRMTGFPTMGTPRKWHVDQLPPIGRRARQRLLVSYANKNRCSDGMAYIYVEPCTVSRRLYALWSQGCLDHRHAMADC